MEPAAKIVADDGHSRDLFGGSVAMSSDSTTALVGASEEDSNGENSGSAYAFQL